MQEKENIDWGKLIVSLLISLGAGGVSWLLTGNSMDRYKGLEKPPLAPPGVVFPIVWTILFILMGIASYLVYRSFDENRKSALRLYVVQLICNIGWSVIFFNFGAFWIAFAWLLLLLALVIAAAWEFFKINNIAGYLMVPYILWIVFAAYLNFTIALLN